MIERRWKVNKHAYKKKQTTALIQVFLAFERFTDTHYGSVGAP